MKRRHFCDVSNYHQLSIDLLIFNMFRYVFCFTRIAYVLWRQAVDILQESSPRHRELRLWLDCIWFLWVVVFIIHRTSNDKVLCLRSMQEPEWHIASAIWFKMNHFHPFSMVSIQVNAMGVATQANFSVSHLRAAYKRSGRSRSRSRSPIRLKTSRRKLCRPCCAFANTFVIRTYTCSNINHD